MAFKTSYNAGLGQPAIDLRGVDTTPRVAIGTVLKGFDDLFGEGEFMYLPGTAGTLAGDAVSYDLAPGAATTTRALAANTANRGFSIAFAVAAVPGGSFGWYQVSGLVVANVNANAVAGTGVGIGNTAGQVSSTLNAGAQLVGARMSSNGGTPAAGQAYITINRPATQTQIT